MAERTKDGLCKDNRAEYNSWQAMRHRCRNPKHPFYHRYGERGIDVCDRWYDSFAAFLEDMGKRPEGHTLDRIDNTKGYYPENCRWATSKEQNHNRQKRSKSVPVGPITYDGVTQSVAAWAREIGISESALRHRIFAYGWPIAQALGFEPRPTERKSARRLTIEWEGKHHYFVDLADRYGISPFTLMARLKRSGWTVEKALLTPVQGSQRK